MYSVELRRRFLESIELFLLQIFAMVSSISELNESTSTTFNYANYSYDYIK